MVDLSNIGPHRKALPSRFRLHTIPDILNQPPRQYLVKKLMGVRELSVWYGQPKTGKSFLALELARCVSTGESFFGYQTTKTPVLYVMAEGSGGAKKRFQAMTKTRKMPDESDFAVIPTRPDILDNGDVDEIIKAAQSMSAGLVILDTLNRTMSGSENSDQDMPSYVAGCDRIREQASTHVAVVHHSGKDKKKGLRGHSSLFGALDLCVRVEKWKARNRFVVEANKDDEEGVVKLFKLDPIVVEQDEDGENVTSLVVSPDVSAKDEEVQLLLEQDEREQVLAQLRLEPLPWDWRSTRWVGHLIADAMGFHVVNDRTEIIAVMKRWEQAGFLVKEARIDPQDRKKKPFAICSSGEI